MNPRAVRTLALLTALVAAAAIATLLVRQGDDDQSALAAEFDNIERYPGAVVLGIDDRFRYRERKYAARRDDDAVLEHYDAEFAAASWQKKGTRPYEGSGRATCYEKQEFRADVITWAQNPSSWTHSVSMSIKRGGCE